MDLFLSSLLNQQQKDLQTVQNLLVSSPPGSDTTSYWPGQVMEAAIWAIAAAPLGAATQIIFAAAASLFGSLLSSVNGAGPPDAVAFDKIADQLQTNYDTSKLAVDSMVYNSAVSSATGILTDQVKIPLIGRYVASVSPWNPDMTDNMAANSSNFNRISFYQQLVGQVFQIHIFAGVVDPNLSWYGPIPSNATWTNVYPTDCTVLVMAQPSFNTLQSSTFPSQALLSDLSRLGFTPQSMFEGQAPLNLSRVDVNYQKNEQGCVLYTTNYTGYEVWVTIYDNWGEKLTYGMVSSGETALWQGHCFWGGNYEVLGELKEGSDTICKTTVSENPKAGFSGGSFSKYALSIQKGSSNCYWDHFN